MTHRTNLYAGWWVYVGLISIGLALVLASFGEIWLWLGLSTMVAASLAAAIAIVMGFGPRRQLIADLSENGLSLDAPRSRRFVPWRNITGIQLLPRPGYWRTSILTTQQPDAWLFAGHGLELAEEIAEVAALPRNQTLDKPVNMGIEHYWLHEPDPSPPSI